MACTNLFKAIPRSFFSGSFYREVGEHWRGRAFAYLLLILVICWLFVSFTMTRGFSHFIYLVNQKIVPQLPTVTFVNGVASTREARPVYLRADNGQEVIIIDTNNHITDFQSTKASVIIQKRAIVLKGRNEVKQYTYPKDFNGVFTSQQVASIIAKSKKWLLMALFGVIFFFGLCISYIWRAGQGLLYALIGMIFVALLKRKLSYGATLNLAILAMTPAIVLKTIFIGFHLTLPFEWAIYILLTLVYLFFAVKANQS